jgi:hypothetical protein
VGNVGYLFSYARRFMRGRFVGNVGNVVTGFKLMRRFTVRGRISVCITLLLHIIKPQLR